MGAACANPILLDDFHAVPRNCPVLLGGESSPSVRLALRWMTPEGLARLARKAGSLALGYSHESPFQIVESAILSGRLKVLFPTVGSAFDRALKDAAPKIRAHAKPKTDETEGSENPQDKEKEKPALESPEWVWIEDTRRPGCDEKILTEAAVLENVYCKVNSVDLMPGDSVTFTIFLKGRDGEDDAKITAIAGRIGEGRKDACAVGKFQVVTEVQGKRLVKKKDKLYFTAKVFAHHLEVKSGLLDICPMKPPFAFSL